MIGWLWKLIPVPARLWVALGLIAALIAGVTLVVHDIYATGFKACKDEQNNAIIEQKDVARKDIIDTGKQYEKLKNNVVLQASDDAPAGPRVRYVIDSLPSPSGSR